MREAGYPAIVSTNCEQTYHRYLRLGERLAMVTTLADVRGPKQTSLGNGWFLRSHYEWFVGDELVAEQDFTSLAYVPPPTRAPRPSRAPDPVPAIDEISPLVIETTPTFIIATAIATRDFYPVHHDRDRAQRDGAKDIFVNILTDTALVGRVVTDWAGPSARLRSIALQLNTPCYAYDTLTLSAGVVNVDGRWTTLTVDGECGAGNHVTATVVIER
jgi:acyl dehydratase